MFHSLRIAPAVTLLILSALPALAEPASRRSSPVAVPPPPVSAAGTIAVASPEQAVALALARAPILRSAEAAAGRRRVTACRPDCGPTRTFPSTANFGGSGSNAGIRSLETTYALSQRIETGGKRQARIGAAENALALTGLDIAALRLDLIREVVRAMAEAVAAGRVVEIARERVRLAGEVLRATQGRVEAGREPFVQQRRAEVARETAAVGFERAQRDAGLASRALAVLLAAPRVEILPARAPWFDELGPKPDPARASGAPLGQLDRARLEGLIAQRRAELDLQRRNAVPDLSVSGVFDAFVREAAIAPSCWASACRCRCSTATRAISSVPGPS
ncbi:TolC family protein [Paeniroseomonas aquatica]|uniref:TolC family protein n=1 Tax=Paeniroseomonas aquatica TaxID=373043 RepID=UPI00361F6DDA